MGAYTRLFFFKADNDHDNQNSTENMKVSSTVSNGVQEVILHDVSEDHLEEPPLELLVVDGDGSL